jgi:hypothetical protein
MSSEQFRSGPGEADDRESDPEISVGRYCLVIGPRQIELHAGETLIGREDACELVVLDSLVSRRHARVLFEDGELSIEDLGSANGTFLNGAKVQGRVPLRPGDRIFIGSFEIDVVWFERDLPASGTFAHDPFDRATPSSGVAVVGKLTKTVAKVSEISEQESWEPVTQRGQRTGDTDLEVIESAGLLAERMFALGRPLVGRDILSGPLNQIRDAATGGRSLDTKTLDAAARYAIKLAQEVFDANWVNLAIEIHLHAGHPMQTETLEQIIALRKKAPIGDDGLIAQYYERVRALMAFMPLGEKVLYAELANVVPRWDEDD